MAENRGISAIKVAGLSRSYQDTVAVDDLTLDIRPGEIYGFLGLNGAGKTTTIRMLMGMIKPTAGTVSIFGTRIGPGRTEIWQRVGYMVETPHAYADLTVRQNLEMVRRLRKLTDRGAVERVIEQLKLTRDADRKARTLSLGNAQRLGLAKALIHNPDLLVLDEPANGLDPAGIVEIRNLLRDLAANHGVTVFMSSHILSEVDRLATRIGVIHRGRLIREFNKEELDEQSRQRLTADVRDPAAALAALESAGISARADGNGTIAIMDAGAVRHPEDIATLLVRADSPPSRLVVEHGDLEAYFLKLVGLGEGSNK